MLITSNVVGNNVEQFMLNFNHFNIIFWLILHEIYCFCRHFVFCWRKLLQIHSFAKQTANVWSIRWIFDWSHSNVYNILWFLSIVKRILSPIPPLTHTTTHQSVRISRTSKNRPMTQQLKKINARCLFYFFNELLSPPWLSVWAAVLQAFFYYYS